MAVPIKMVNERATSHHGGLNASRAGITMGENKGNIDDHLARLESGDSTLCIIMYRAKITGMVMGRVKELLSPISSPIAEPTAAKREEYKKYPPKKNNVNKGTMSHQLI